MIHSLALVKDLLLSCEQWGSGAAPLVCFHGYSNAAGMFYPLERLVGRRFTIYSIDLPHHGRSRWREGILFTKDLLAKALHQILEKHPGQKIAFAAFSLGGRAVLSAIEQMPESVRGAVLVAPDGLGYHPLYRAMTGNPLGRGLFAGFTRKPQRYLSLLNKLHQRGLVDNSRYQFAKYFIQTEQARAFLRNVWLDLRALMPDKRRARRNIREAKIPVNIIMGRHDRIIPPWRAESFAKGLDTASVEVLDKGHRLMDSDTFARMAQWLMALPVLP